MKLEGNNSGSQESEFRIQNECKPSAMEERMRLSSKQRAERLFTGPFFCILTSEF
jgi:hypothetical protein